MGFGRLVKDSRELRSGAGQREAGEGCRQGTGMVTKLLNAEADRFHFDVLEGVESLRTLCWATQERCRFRVGEQPVANQSRREGSKKKGLRLFAVRDST